jgi:four helix bundle protein
MNYQSWLAAVPKEITDDALWRMEVYRLSLFAYDLAWHDVTKLMRDRPTLGLASQLFEAAGSVSANLAEGYGRSSNKDRARFQEYSLGSARESRNWYYGGRHVLGNEVTRHRLQLATHIIRHLLNIIPAERGSSLHEEPPEYTAEMEGDGLERLLEQVPMP